MVSEESLGFGVDGFLVGGRHEDGRCPLVEWWWRERESNGDEGRTDQGLGPIQDLCNKYENGGRAEDPGRQPVGGRGI